MFEVKFYTLPHGEKPVGKFLDGLDEKTRAKTLAYLLTLAEYGYTNWGPYSRTMRNELFELRVITPQAKGNKSDDHLPRIIFFFCTGNEIVLTNGYVKRSIKTPPVEIERAEEYKADYEGSK